MPRGFILQPTYRIESGRPVVMLYGILEGGGRFVVREATRTPQFWVRAAQAEMAHRLGATIASDAPQRRSMDGEPLACVEVIVPSDVPPLRDRLTAAGIETFEADVRFAYRGLIDRDIRGAVEIDGDARVIDGVQVFDDPVLTPAAWSPALSVLSIDIETDPRISRVLSIAMVGAGADDVLLHTPRGYDCPDTAIACATEREMLERFVSRVREIDPDVITGWNVVDFDLAFLLRRAEQEGVTMRIGRGREPLLLRESRGVRGGREPSLPGRLVIDGMRALRGAFVRLEDWSLDGAAHELLGRGKLITGSNRGEEIIQAFENDRAHLVDYNRLDAQLVLDILDEVNVIPLSVERSQLTGMPPDRVDASVASFDFLYLAALSKRGIAGPTIREVPGLESQGGGHVLDPEPGMYVNVVVLDFQSLYPSIIRTFQIDPLGRRSMTSETDDLVAPNGARFAREPGILPALIDELFPRRAEAKRVGDDVKSHAIKILMNSFYGVLGTSACRFASAVLVNAITGFGREILTWCRDAVERAGYRVIYGDTDSLFIVTDAEDATAARAVGCHLAESLSRDLAEHVAARWRVESRLVVEFEKLYTRLVLPMMRGGVGGARKRYAGLIDDGDGAHVELTGLEAVRRDWTALARRLQRELYERLFADEPLDEHVRAAVEALRAGTLDEELVYRKGLRRPLESYVKTTPPHVVAARKMSTPPRRVVRYVMTHAGPEPVGERTAAIDHEHYVQKQVRAVAEPILTLLGLDFDTVIGDEHQLRLW